MSQFYVGEQPLADSSNAGVTFPNGSIYGSRDLSANRTYDGCESPLQPKTAARSVSEKETDRHAPWASGLPISESIGCLPDGPGLESGNRTSSHHMGTSENLGSDSPSPSSLIFSSVGGALSPSYNWQQHPLNTITCTPPIPPRLPPFSSLFASSSTQPITFRVSRTVVPRMNLDGVIDLCPGCYVSPYPTVWTMEEVGCVHCQLLLPRSMVLNSDFLATPTPALAIPPDRPRSPNACSFQNRTRKGKSPQTRVRRPVKPQSPSAKEPRCCPFTSSGNITLPCSHTSCYPPPNVGLLSRRFAENEKWERARQDAVASFTYENCGFYKLPIEIIWMIIDLYPRLDYSYMRSIRAEPSVYNHKFEVLRNLIGVSKSFRKTFYRTYWETFEMALTYPRKRLPEPSPLDPGAEPARHVSRVKELQGLRKTFWNLRDTAACIRTLTFRIDRDSEIMQLFVDCLLALPNLHTLEIAPTSLPLVTLFGNAFKNRPQYRSVRKLISPAGTHPILQCLPNLEELVCTRGEKPHILITRVFQAYDSMNTVTTFKRFELIGSSWTDMVGKELIRCFPNIQKLAMRKPSIAHLEKLSSLTEISELDLWIVDSTEAAQIKRLKAKATEILQQSKPRIVCECDDLMDVDPESPVKEQRVTGLKQEPGVKHEDGESKSGGCRCKPPKRVFRLKYLVRRHGQWGTPFWGSERVEEIEVSPPED